MGTGVGMVFHSSTKRRISLWPGGHPISSQLLSRDRRGQAYFQNREFTIGGRPWRGGINILPTNNLRTGVDRLSFLLTQLFDKALNVASCARAKDLARSH